MPGPRKNRAGGGTARKPKSVGHRALSRTGGHRAYCNPFVYARTPSGVSCPPPNAHETGAHKLSHTRERKRKRKRTRAHTLTHSTVRSRCEYKCGWVGHLCTGVPYRTGPCILWPHAQKLERLHCPGCLPLPNRRGRCESALSPPACGCRSGSTVWPPRFPLCLCSVVVYSAWAVLPSSYPNHWESGLG